MVEALARLYPSYGAKHVASILGLTEDAVRMKAKKMRVLVDRDQYSDRMQIINLCKARGLNPTDVQHSQDVGQIPKGWQGVLCDRCDVGKHPYFGAWSDGSIAILKETYPTHGADHVSKMTGIPYTYVKRKARAMGLRKALSDEHRRKIISANRRRWREINRCAWQKQVRQLHPVLLTQLKELTDGSPNG